jgi:predicted Holliday junction resolvase-like endonuclease
MLMMVLMMMLMMMTMAMLYHANIVYMRAKFMRESAKVDHDNASVDMSKDISIGQQIHTHTHISQEDRKYSIDENRESTIQQERSPHSTGRALHSTGRS